MLKVIFLDIDGVLNTDASMGKWTQEFVDGDVLDYSKMLCPEAVERLNRITDESGARIVVSSSWRMAGKEKVFDDLRRAGVTGELLDITPAFWDGDRGAEVQAWISMNRHRPEAQDGLRILVLDDDCDYQDLHHEHCFIQTSWEEGLLEDHVSTALDYLEER